MSIAAYIRDEVLRPRLQKAGCLVVYDPERRYRDLCRTMAGEGVEVVDASDSSIESREAASAGLLRIGRGEEPNELLIYVPAPPPTADEERQGDPFAGFAVCGASYPNGPADDYLNLCLKAKPDHATAIRQIFANDPNPPFAVIDKIGGGVGWPALRSLLATDSPSGIVFALLVPSEDQKGALKDSDAWVSEARDLVAAALGLKLKTRAKAWSPIADELWRFVLFSEFAFDLPGELPEALSDVPRAGEAARPLVEELCDRLRRDQVARVTYIERAETIEKDLSLSEACADINELGVRDTFPFEERTFLLRAVTALSDGGLDGVREIIGRHTNSVWLGKGESQAQWALVAAAQALIEACQDLERDLPRHLQSQEALISFYVSRLREADRLHREFEQAKVALFEIDFDLGAIVDQARNAYRRLAGKAQQAFTKHLEAAGWPPDGRTANAAVYDTFVAPALAQHGRRVAYVLVDALRYELGVVLKQQLGEDNPTELTPAYAQLPTVTKVGMASLLPGAAEKLRLTKDGDDLLPMIDGIAVGTVPQRMDFVRRRLGDRFAETALRDLLKSKMPPPKTVDLFVVRSVELDSQLENDAETALEKLHDVLRRIRHVVDRLRGFGFHEVVLAADHGFCLNTHAEAGDVCSKPSGNWLVLHERSLLGNGSANDHNFATSAEKVGIRGDFAQFGGPRSMAPYRNGMTYFHGGASLQEAIVPVLTVRLQPALAKAAPATVTLTYRNGAKRITTRLPVFDVVLNSDDLFARGEEFEIRLEAQTKKGDVVGEAKPGGPVNPATGTVTLVPGQPAQVTLRMQDEFEGKFTVKALNPTTEATYASLDLETSYVV